ncbi:MAG: carboxypeptidase-like regulatory domain-containing protein [Sphingobacteriaceae bacterium]|jgi:hypothetical protein|nr:carboxypeptidase-like regulatory domain-containing protein [Sphingobacteriaceae bacterium]
MRLYLLLLLILFANPLNAQTINGTVLDALTKMPISNAQIITPISTSLTNNAGKFELTNIKIGDKFAIRILGYETSEFTINNVTDSLRIFLKQNIFQLNEVMVKTKRNYRNDSLRLRKEYAAVFAYKPPNLTDMFIKVDPSYRSPFANINPNSTASIIKFNALSAFSLFGKKKNANSKLKTILLKTEETNYVDHLFSEEKVADITKLKGDSLVNFMNTYRPSILALKKMTGYELIKYIKTSYVEFIKQ